MQHNNNTHSCTDKTINSPILFYDFNDYFKSKYCAVNEKYLNFY